MLLTAVSESNNRLFLHNETNTSMKSLELNFELYSKQEWIEIIKKSLKSGSIEEFQWKIDDNVFGESFAHYDDLQFKPDPLGSNDKVKNWITGIDYSLVPNKDINSFIKNHSKFGLESFIVYANESNYDFEDLFRGIEIDKYDIILSTRNGIDDILFMERLKDYCIKKQYNHKKLRLNLRIPDDKPEGMLELYNYLNLNFPELRYFYRSERELAPNPEKYLATTINSITEFLRESDMDKQKAIDFLERTKVHFFMTEKFLSGIAMLRAFKILWANYLKVFGATKQDARIILGANHDAFTSDHNADLIIASIISMTGAIAGVHSINISPRETDMHGIEEVMRLFINVQNIMKDESNLHIVKDALSGSFSTESATNRLAEEVWSNLK